MARIVDPDDFYINELHGFQRMMLLDIQCNLSSYFLLYHDYKHIIDATLKANKYRMADRDELNQIRKTFLISKEKSN